MVGPHQSLTIKIRASVHYLRVSSSGSSPLPLSDPFQCFPQSLVCRVSAPVSAGVALTAFTVDSALRCGRMAFSARRKSRDWFPSLTRHTPFLRYAICHPNFVHLKNLLSNPRGLSHPSVGGRPGQTNCRVLPPRCSGNDRGISPRFTDE
jgi:hypothetical protein